MFQLNTIKTIVVCLETAAECATDLEVVDAESEKLWPRLRQELPALRDQAKKYMELSIDRYGEPIKVPMGLLGEIKKILRLAPDPRAGQLVASLELIEDREIERKS
jgi:hypothetical protein